MKRLFTAMIALLLVFSFVFVSGCDKNANIYEDRGDPSKHLVAYFTKNATSQDDMRVYINKYNNLCDEHDKIDIVEFDTIEELRTTISTEMMAGEGPDIICDASLNLYSYIENDMLADINVLMEKDESNDKIDLSNYNEVVMNAGVFNGKRVIVPLTYFVNTYVSTKEQLKKYNIPIDVTIEYGDISEVFSDFIKEASSDSSMDTIRGASIFYEQLVLDNINFRNKTISLESDEFMNDLHALTEIYLDRNFKELSMDVYDGSYLFTDVSVGRIDNLIAEYVAVKNHYSQTITFVNNLFSEDTEIEASINRFVAINANSMQKEKAYKFVKFLLDEASYKGIKAGGIPTNYAAFESMLQKAERYDQNDGDAHEYVNTDIFIDDYKKLIGKITSCNLNNLYFRYEILNPALKDFVSGKVTEGSFVDQIASKTKIYFDE